MSLEWIDVYVEGLIDYCNTTDIFEIYKTLETYVNKVESSSLMLQGNDAVYIRNYFGFEIVFIRDDLPYKLEKFILSHELAHAILHVELIQSVYNSRLINKGKLERQANYFALKLLEIKADSIYQEGFTREQISKDLFITESSIELLI